MKGSAVNLLEGSIAFALALAGLASLCTVIIEILHRVAGLRSEGLKVMLETYFEEVLQKDLPAEKIARLKGEFIDGFTQNKFMERFGEGTSWLPAFVRRRLLQVDAVPTDEFLRHLPESAVFRELEAKAIAGKEQLLKDLGAKYEHYGKQVSAYFKGRAQVLSLAVGVAMALFGNIDAGRILDAYLKDPAAAQRMEAQAANIKTLLDAHTPAAEGKSELPAIKADVDKAMADFQGYQQLGLPMGWAYYPNCLQGRADGRCAQVRQAVEEATAAAPAAGTKRDCLLPSLWASVRHDPAGFLQWLFTVLVTGLLIGLGGPFWYELAVKLSTVRQAFNGKAALPARTDGAGKQGG